MDDGVDERTIRLKREFIATDREKPNASRQSRASLDALARHSSSMCFSAYTVYIRAHYTSKLLLNALSHIHRVEKLIN